MMAVALLPFALSLSKGCPSFLAPHSKKKAGAGGSRQLRFQQVRPERGWENFANDQQSPSEEG